MEIKNHILQGVRYIATPNRGGPIRPLYLIQHFTADNNPKSTINWFLDKRSEASAHLLIDRDGDIIQFAPFNIKTWHAGLSKWSDISGLNSYSIGIELTNLGQTSKGWQEYTPKQLDVCYEVSQLLVSHYGLIDILGHSDISPGRKVDPGPKFPMNLFKEIVKPKSHTETISDLNLRAGAGTKYKVTSVLPKGTLLNVLGTSADWVKVQAVNSKLIGWVNKNYLK